ncbi:hypothetical protein [Ferrovum myxofaciens]|uniref:Uncharacterized protein n=1 Tax=Ferrovum myxofaciens TaxID=416213 RepID=A0A9E6SXS1_9PROT|nr:hypothetical protein [Ferrovum myxofaciens]QKE37316.1 MAG: hypothetical protein HO273_00065 [Ferrovum myxofaciens]QWY74961.1 MAG: hypothetical protein JVY19_00515 [Ferrovum myxofaciens]QWY77709.1 MAG: hypothetical protein JZL65_01070 [Ferrovum myxofaciens]
MEKEREEALLHSSNEWADLASNGLQWIKNISDGVSTPADAIKNMEEGFRHCRENDKSIPAEQDSINEITGLRRDLENAKKERGRYELALRHIARNAFTTKDWIAKYVLEGFDVTDAILRSKESQNAK